MQPIIFENVIYKVQGETLLGPINLKFSSTDITILMGPNGSGKSLLLSLCHGILAPTEGHVTKDGILTKGSRRNRGFIFQKPIILRRSVKDNISFPLQMKKISSQNKKKRLSQLLDLVRLSDKASQPAALLSGGELQRLAIARAMISNPVTIIMDEPTSNLDPKATDEFEKIITAVHHAGVGFIWVTHDLEQAKRCAQKIIFLKNGKVTQETLPKNLFDKPQAI